MLRFPILKKTKRKTASSEQVYLFFPGNQHHLRYEFSGEHDTPSGSRTVQIDEVVDGRVVNRKRLVFSAEEFERFSAVVTSIKN